MEESLDVPRGRATDAEMLAEIDRVLAQMEQMDERIRRSQEETERLRAKTWAVLDELKAK